MSGGSMRLKKILAQLKAKYDLDISEDTDLKDTVVKFSDPKEAHTALKKLKNAGIDARYSDQVVFSTHPKEIPLPGIYARGENVLRAAKIIRNMHLPSAQFDPFTQIF